MRFGHRGAKCESSLASKRRKTSKTFFGILKFVVNALPNNFTRSQPSSRGQFRNHGSRRKSAIDLSTLNMCISCNSNEKRHSARNAYTLIELLAVMFIVGFVTAVHEAVRAKHGEGPALLASVLAVVASALLVILFWDWTSRSNKRRLTQLREQYRNIYKVKELPTTAKSIVKPAAAEIQIGDYGRDARPSRKDGLIHLQGLTPKWQVVWHAGFRPDQIEKVAVKPHSQYDYWTPYWAKPPPPPPPPCPYPVRERNTPTMGLPHHSGKYFENYPSQYYQSRKDVPEAD